MITIKFNCNKKEITGEWNCKFYSSKPGFRRLYIDNIEYHLPEKEAEKIEAQRERNDENVESHRAEEIKRGLAHFSKIRRLNFYRKELLSEIEDAGDALMIEEIIKKQIKIEQEKSNEKNINKKS